MPQGEPHPLRDSPHLEPILSVFPCSLSLSQSQRKDPASCIPHGNIKCLFQHPFLELPLPLADDNYVDWTG